MKMKLFNFILLVSVLIFLGVIPAYASDEELFTANVPPDALIVLDLTGSMNWTPAGPTMYISDTKQCGVDTEYYETSGPGHTKACKIEFDSAPKYSNANCSGPFYKISRAGFSTDCSRVEIAKRAIFDFLDNNDDNIIDKRDENSLGIRIGYMRYYNCSSDDTGGNYSSGCITLIKPITDPKSDEMTPYDKIWDAVKNEKAVGGTPLASALNEAKLYLDDHKNGNNAKKIKPDPAKDCRKKFVIFITDGQDTFACSGSGNDEQVDQYKRRRETVAKAKALWEAGYQVFVVGFGASMPHYLKNTLNWAAYFGGSDNPLEDNKPSPITDSYHPENVTSCKDDSYTSHNLGDGLHYYARSNDPGEITLEGYAFLASDASELTAALKTIIVYIQEHSYSFTAPTVPSVRLIDGDTVYISSFTPNYTPFWKGNLKAYRLNEFGTLPVGEDGFPKDETLRWNAEEKLKSIEPNSRNIITYVHNTLKSFIYDNLTNVDLDVSSNQDRRDLVNYIRGIDAYDVNDNGDRTENKEWRLGDIFHSNAVIVGAPSIFYEDTGFSGTGGFYEKNKDRTKIIIVGANDGMLHAFDASTGEEKWGFIPNCLLKNLKLMKFVHTYYVDASPKVADVWFDKNNDNNKSAEEWKTVLVNGLRKGGKQYFALDITDTLNPQFLWEFPKTHEVLDKAGQSWSEPAIGKVKIEQGNNLIEKWVGFIGGGFDPNERGDEEGTIGNVFFIIDIVTGEIIKEFSGLDRMTHSFAASPTPVDTNLDGYVDKVYIGDLGGQMWVFDVSFDEINKKSNSQWTGKRLFKGPKAQDEKHKIYYPPAVAFDQYRNPWVFFGTGDRESPTDTNNPQERFYAVRDDGTGDYPREEKDLSDVTNANTFQQDQTKKGWYIKLEKTGKRLEKVLARPVVFNRLLYFTTFTYDDKGDACSVGGDAKLYTVDYLSGGGALLLDDYLQGKPSRRSEDIGEGVPSAPVISVNLKGKATVIIGITSGQILSREVISLTTNKEILYWREVIP